MHVEGNLLVGYFNLKTLDQYRPDCLDHSPENGNFSPA